MLRHSTPANATFGNVGKTAWEDDHIPSSTWAARPNAAQNAGKLIHISNIGLTGSLWVSDGTRWHPLNGSVVLGQSGTSTDAPANTNENILGSVLIPGGAMGLHGRLEITSLWSMTNNANVKQLRVKLGASSFYGANHSSVTTLFQFTAIQNRGVANAQVGAPTVSGYTMDSGGVITAAIDTSADVTLTLTGMKIVAGDTLTLQAYSVTLKTP